MVKKGYKQSEEQKQKIRLSNIGKHHKKETILKICLMCNSEFYTQRYNTQFCSRTCANKIHHARGIEKGTKLTKEHKLKIGIGNLGKTKGISKNKGNKNGHYNKFKGIEKGLTKNKLIELHHVQKMSLCKIGKLYNIAPPKNLLLHYNIEHINYNKKGDITPIQQKIRDLSLYKEWRTKCFERDNYTCRKCHQRGGCLEIHHFSPLSKIIRQNNLKNIEQAKKCTELFDVNNGITVCISCHKAIDKYRARRL